MNSYIKVLTPSVLSILIGSLTFIFAHTERGDVGISPKTARKDVSVSALPGEERGRGFPSGFAEQLNLNAEQKEQITALMNSSETDAKIYFEKVKDADEQLKLIIDSGNFDEPKARQIVGTKTQAMAELEIIHLRTGTAINNLLTPDQQAKLREIKSNRPEPPPSGGKLGMPPPPPLLFR